MPSEKAKANKALIAVCSACNKSVSTEEMVSLTGRNNGTQQPFSVCIPCADSGWRPPGFSGFYQKRLA